MRRPLTGRVKWSLSLLSRYSSGPCSLRLPRLGEITRNRNQEHNRNTFGVLIVLYFSWNIDLWKRVVERIWRFIFGRLLWNGMVRKDSLRGGDIIDIFTPPFTHTMYDICYTPTYYVYTHLLTCVCTYLNFHSKFSR